MNYRHAFHAGNHTEVFKHSALSLLLLELRKKPKPFTILDTHAGAGLYDLHSPESEKSGEAQEGVGLIFEKDLPAASAYSETVQHLNPNELHCYPGSPAIVRALLRKDDRLIACELRKDDAARLRANFGEDRRISVHCRDGYEAIGAFVPPPTRRGLVFIDPPFEERDEFLKIANALNSGLKKWPAGIFLAWYPLKDRAGIQTLRARYEPGTRTPTLCCEFLREPFDGIKLVGSGLIVSNPPWQMESKLTALCRELLEALDARTGSYKLDWWIREQS
jgi:23S rRNA (adenine2030-N6)-methyltransferase